MARGSGLVPPAYGTRRPARSKTWGPDLADFVEQLGIELLPWQRLVVDEWLAHDSKGNLIHPTGCLVVPRRQGKSLLLVARSLFGMWWLGERRVSFTAQNHQTAGEIFAGLCDLVEDQAPELLVSKRLANGQQRLEIRAHDGSTARFTPSTRTASGGRGMETDLLLLDEGMYLQATHMAALTPLVAKAQANGRGQILVTSSAGTTESEVLRQLRDRGRELHKVDGKGLAYHEWCAPDDCEPDDPKAWQAANPSMGTPLLSESFLASQLLLNSPEGFRREHLGGWGEAFDLPAIDPKLWAQAAGSPEPLYTDDPCWLAYDVAFDKTAARLLLFHQGQGGRVQVQVLETITSGEGISEAGFIDLVKHHAAELQPEAIGYDELSGGAIAQQLAAEYNLVRLPVRKYAVACQALRTAVTEGRVTHDGEPSVALDLSKGVKRAHGDGAWIFDRRGREIPGATALAIGHYLASDPEASDSTIAAAS